MEVQFSIIKDLYLFIQVFSQSLTKIRDRYRYFTMDNLDGFTPYEAKQSKIIKINRKIGNGMHSHLIINVIIMKKVNIPKHEEKTVETNILIEDSNMKFNMLVKRHKLYPLAGRLKTIGFISPKVSNQILKVKILNPNNHEIRMRQGDILGVLVITPYIKMLL